MVKKILSLLSEASQKLGNLGLSQEEALQEARILLAEVLGTKLLEIYLYERPLGQRQLGRFQEFLARRLAGQPLAYVLGKVEFFGRCFRVDHGVLIPRPETEILVEAVLDRLSPGLQIICELGVGSGVIALTLAMESKDLLVVGVEKSPQALRVALKNRQRFGLEARVHLIQGDWLAPLKPGARFQAIVSNPPYVAPEEWQDLSCEVRDYEPQEALLAPEKGLYFIRRTLEKAPRYLLPGGYVFLEIGYRQAPQVAKIARNLGYKFSFEKDLQGYQRVLIAQKHT